MSNLPFLRLQRVFDGAVRRANLADIAVIFGASLLCIPFLRSVYWVGDEGIWLHGAQRLLRGEKLYVDFFEVHPPLGFIITATWLKLFGQSLVSARILAAGVIVAISLLIYRLCRWTGGNTYFAAVMTFDWIVMSQGEPTQVNHHWFVTLFSLLTLASGLSTRARGGPIAAGLAAGAALMTTSSRGALAALAGTVAYLGRGKFPALLRYMLAGLAVALAALMYCARFDGLQAAYDDVIGFAATRYSDVQWVPFGHGQTGRNWPLTSVFYVAAIATAGLAISRPHVLQDRTFRSCCAFAAAGLIGCFPRPDFAHISFAAPLALPLIAYVVGHSLNAKARLIAVGIVLLLGVQPAFQYYQLSREALRSTLIVTQAGRVSFPLDRGETRLLEHLAQLPSADPITFYPYDPLLPFLAARDHPPQVDVFVPGYSTAAQFDAACARTIDRAKWVVFDRLWSDPTFLKGVFLSLRNPNPPEKVRMETALRQNFDPLALDGTFELRRRARQKASCRVGKR